MRFEFVMTEDLKEFIDNVYRYMTIKNLIKGIIYFGIAYVMIAGIIILFE